jgi:hypothetical protein
LLKITDKIDQSGDDSDDGAFEDIEIDSDAENNDGVVVDIDELKVLCLSLVNIPYILELTKPIPQLSKLSF